MKTKEQREDELREVALALAKVMEATRGHRNGVKLLALTNALAFEIGTIENLELRNAVINTLPRAVLDIIRERIIRRAQRAQDARAPQATSGGQTPSPPAGRGAKN
jgi:hypothetical protein